MGLEEIIKKAKEQLPFANGYKNDRIRVPVLDSEIDPTMDGLLDAPTEYDKSCHIVEFRKQYVNSIIIGWEFVALINGV